MRSLLNPKWLIVINTIPLLILSFIYWSHFAVINSLLETESLNLWKRFGSVLLLMGVLNLSYALFLILKKKKVSLIYGILILISYIPFLYLYGNFADEIFPFSIPRWMVSDTSMLYPGTFLMPTLAYALFILVVHLTPKREDTTLWKNFVVAALIPIAWYLFSQLILPFWKPVDSNFNIHALIIFIIIGTLFFLFFLIRAIYILAIRKKNSWNEYDLIWKIPISIVLPLLGLAINNGHGLNPLGVVNQGIFGNFTNHWFYILAILNGILICLPNLNHKTYRLLLFIGRCISFSFIIYFFIVFLPFLPLSIIAIVAFGIGFLMLTPLLLFVIQVIEISQDFKFLKKFYSNQLIIIISIIGFLTIPSCISINYSQERITLHKTLDYIYSPNYDKNYQIDKSSLSKTLATIKNHKERNRGGIFGSQLPYLSSYFNWLALDNLTLSNSKINTIESIFFDKKKLELKQERIRNDSVSISKIGSNSKFDEKQNAWISWVDIEITNQRSSNLAEYSTILELPVGAWISDYYLYVEDEKEYGVLAEKKAATWIFSHIRNENKDPGILYYLNGNKVAFRVFPFSGNEVRKTGFEILHKEPIQFSIDGHSVNLGNASKYALKKDTSTNDVIYVLSKEKATLKKIQRTPYYHFLIDVSKGKESLIPKFIERIEKLLSTKIIKADNAKISFVNMYSNTIVLDKNWKASLKKQDYKGGYYLDRAIKKALFSSYKENDNSYPILIAVTDSIQNAILSNNYADFKITYPENDFVYHLDKTGNLKAHSLLANSSVERTDEIDLNFNQTVLEYIDNNGNKAFLPDDNTSSIVLKNDQFDIDDTQVIEKNWKSGLLMQGQWISGILHPEKTDSKWLNSVRNSFKSKLMTPYTSYIVVENEAQKAVLKKKQQQILSGKKSLDVGDDTQRMSEPNLLLLIFLLIFGIFLFKRRKQTKKSIFNEI